MKNDWQKAIDAGPMVVLGMSEYHRLLAQIAGCATTYERVESIEDPIADLGPGVAEPSDTVDGVNLVAEPVVRTLNPASPLLSEDVDFLLDALEERLRLVPESAPIVDYDLIEDGEIVAEILEDANNPLTELL